MMQRGKLLAILGIFLIILVSGRVLWNVHFTHTESVRAIGGVLDLRHVDLTASHPLTLDGEWEFYPSVFLYNDDHNEALKPSLIEVPGGWNAALSQNGDTSYGYGTYRLTILVNPLENINYSFRVSSVRSASQVFINGQLHEQMGQPAADEADYYAKNIPYTVTFVAAGMERIELTIQAANFTDARQSGLIRSLKFGTQSVIQKEIELSTAAQLSVAAVFILHAIYALIIFMIGARDRRLLYFSLIIISADILLLLGSEEKLLQSWFSLGNETSFRITAILTYVCMYSLLLCIMHMLSSFWRKMTNIGLAPVLILASMLALAAPAHVFLPVYNALNLVYFIMFVMVIFSILRKAVRIMKADLLMVMSLLAFIHHFVWWTINMFSGIKVIYYPFDLIIAMITFSSIWFKRYFQILSETNELTAKLQTEIEKKDQFLASTSHELRNPLHVMINVSQVLLEREGSSLNEQSERDLRMMLDVSQHMSLLINDLLDAMRIKENDIELDKQSLSLHTVASGVIDMLRFFVERKPIRLNNLVPVDFPNVYADENRLTQILFNLLHNAVKFTREGEINLNVQVVAGKALVQVEDTGQGFDPHVKEKLFEPYVQMPSHSAEAAGGFGLGLSICKQLVELHGGFLEVESVVGQGSKFSFTLDFAASSADHYVQTSRVATINRDLGEGEVAAAGLALHPAVDETALFRSHEANKIRLMVVDDDPINLQVLINIFSAADDYEVVPVTNGHDALKLLGMYEWDLVITDVMMPHMTGFELTEKIRERYPLFELPIILLTARYQEEDINIAFRIGANDYVNKPVNGTELKSRVRTLVELKKSVNSYLLMEGAWLQAQIKPHFILNTFNAVAALSHIDVDRMDALVDEFSNYIRLSIDFMNEKQVVSIKHELDLVKSYLYIEKERFSERLNVKWEVDDIAFNLPPLSIQPLVENAVRHGILKRARGGTLHILVKDHQDFIQISIMDDGVGIDEKKLEGLLDASTDSPFGIGLRNTDRRLRRLYGHGLEIESEPNKGTNVSFKVIK